MIVGKYFSGKIFCEYVEKLFEVILVKSRIPMTSNDRNTVYILILNWYLNKIVLSPGLETCWDS